MARWKESDNIPLRRPKGVSNSQWTKAVQLYTVAANRGDKFPELTVAQAALETGWFKKESGRFNYFGQKAGKGQKGSYVTTHEVSNNSFYKTKAKFRDYGNLEEAVDERIRKWGSKYKNANNIDEAISSIWRYNAKKGRGEGYATDSKYDVKIKSILGMMGMKSNAPATTSKNISTSVSSDIKGAPIDYKSLVPNLVLPKITQSNDLDIKNDFFERQENRQLVSDYIDNVQSLVSLREQEEKRKQQELKENSYKAALQEKIDQRNFLADLINNTSVEFVERKKTQIT